MQNFIVGAALNFALPEMVLIVFILGVANNPDVDLISEPRIPIDCRGSRPDRWEGSAQGKPASPFGFCDCQMTFLSNTSVDAIHCIGQMEHKVIQSICIERSGN